jgi:hypothetical protein
MWTVEALKEWHDFYVLVGTAGATLLALLFVAAINSGPPKAGTGRIASRHINGIPLLAPIRVADLSPAHGQFG